MAEHEAFRFFYGIDVIVQNLTLQLSEGSFSSSNGKITEYGPLRRTLSHYFWSEGETIARGSYGLQLDIELPKTGVGGTIHTIYDAAKIRLKKSLKATRAVETFEFQSLAPLNLAGTTLPLSFIIIKQHPNQPPERTDLVLDRYWRSVDLSNQLPTHLFLPHYQQ